MQRSARTILERLVRIPSPTGEERAAAEAFAVWCADAGLEVALQEVAPGRPNVIARWKGGGGPHLLLTGHLDTVPVGEGWTRDPFGAEVEGKRLYGRGACDMKGGLAAMLGAIVDLQRRGEEPAGDVTVAAVVGEEEDSAGTRALVAQGMHADRAVLAEPTSMQLVISNRGLLNFRVVVKGASAHASAPALGRNAVTAAAAIVLELESIADELTRRPHPQFGPPSLTVGTIHGGTRPYVVPAAARSRSTGASTRARPLRRCWASWRQRSRSPGGGCHGSRRTSSRGRIICPLRHRTTTGSCGR